MDLKRSSVFKVEDIFLNEESVDVFVRRGEREEAMISMNLFVAFMTRPDSSVELCVRLTNPSDEFFIYTLRMNQAEYARFREAQSINVDFTTFPRYIISLIQEVSLHVVSPTVSRRLTLQNETLRFIESNQFRDIEVLSLSMHQESDAGQKNYLAQKLRDTLGQLDECSRSLRDVRESSSLRIEQQEEKLRELNERIHSTQLDYNNSLCRIKTEHCAAINSLREKHASEIEGWRNQVSSLETRILHETTVKEKELRSLQNDLVAEKAKVQQLQSELELAREETRKLFGNTNSIKNEQSDLQKRYIEVVNSNQSLEHRLQELKQDATLAQRQVDFLQNTLSERDELVRELQKDKIQISQILESALNHKKDMDSRLVSNEKSLEKCHHIIASLKSAMDHEKERSRMVLERQANMQESITEKTIALQQVKSELTMLNERLKISESEKDVNVSQLHDCRKKINELNEQAAEKDNTIVYLQRQLNKIGIGQTYGPSLFNPTTAVASSVMENFRKFETDATKSTRFNDKVSEQQGDNKFDHRGANRMSLQRDVQTLSRSAYFN